MRSLLGTCLVCVGLASPTVSAERPLVEPFLHQGNLLAGETALRARLQKQPADDEARFGLGVLQFIRGIERLGQSLHRLGTAPRNGALLEIPFLRLPVPPNPNPEEATYVGVRRIFSDLLEDLRRADLTLAEIKSDDVKLAVRLGLVRLDLDGDGKAEDSFLAIVQKYANRMNRELPNLGEIDVAFDSADVAWLRGYCHLLSAMLEIALAHDERELFEHTAHLLFANVDTDDAAALVDEQPGPGGLSFDSLADLVAFIHLVRHPVAEPERMKAALGHLKQVFQLSRQSWKLILAEADNDREWIPNPKQGGALRVPIRQDQVESWLEFVDEAEALLDGRRLAPFWRGRRNRGVNLHRVFTEPQTFDLVLWIQGSGAVPYLEEGKLTDPRVWDRLYRVFGGDLFSFGVWFN